MYAERSIIDPYSVVQGREDKSLDLRNYSTYIPVSAYNLWLVFARQLLRRCSKSELIFKPPVNFFFFSINSLITKLTQRLH